MAVFIRYTDVVMLLVAIAAVLLTFHKARIPARSLSWWLGSVVLFAGGVMLFDEAFYGGALKTGYAAGEITFALRAIVPNLKIMPANLLKAMPALLLGLAALLWMAVRVIRSRPSWRTRPPPPRSDAGRGYRTRARRRVARPLGPVCGVYLDRRNGISRWPVADGGGGAGGGIHVIRFYLPAIGLIALLGAWLLMQLPKWLPGAFLSSSPLGDSPPFAASRQPARLGPTPTADSPGTSGTAGGHQAPARLLRRAPEGFPLGAASITSGATGKRKAACRPHPT